VCRYPFEAENRPRIEADNLTLAVDEGVVEFDPAALDDVDEITFIALVE
jgi:hypothetical protein